MKMEVKVYFAYSIQDQRLAEMLLLQLAVLERRGLVRVSHQGTIELGAGADEQLRAHLQSADVILLLLSAPFLADEGHADELERALARRREAKVVPILGEPCVLDAKTVQGLQVLPRDGRAISEHENLAAVWAQITREIEAQLPRRAPASPQQKPAAGERPGPGERAELPPVLERAELPPVLERAEPPPTLQAGSAEPPFAADHAQPRTRIRTVLAAAACVSVALLGSRLLTSGARAEDLVCPAAALAGSAEAQACAQIARHLDGYLKTCSTTAHFRNESSREGRIRFQIDAEGLAQPDLGDGELPGCLRNPGVPSVQIEGWGRGAVSAVVPYSLRSTGD